MIESTNSQDKNTVIQPQFAMLAQRAANIYVHVPFCARRCGYCVFTLVAKRDYLIEQYLDALAFELEQMRCQDRVVDTLYLGGGTPSYLPPVQLRRLFELLQRHFKFSSTTEFCLEANPLDIEGSRVELFREFGVNRVSLGVQSLQDAKLNFLERDHRSEDIRRAVEILRPFLASLSIDLIFGVPNESPLSWREDLEQALCLPIDHLSAYSLSIERGSQFYNRSIKREPMSSPDDDVAGLYEVAQSELARRGFEHYEISNYAKPGHSSHHNLAYWNGRAYLGLGPGASSFADGVRWSNHGSVSNYIRRFKAQQSAVDSWERLSPELAARERLIFGMRKLEGMDLTELARETGFELDSLVQPEKLKMLLQEELVVIEEGRIRLTQRGLLVSDSIWVELV